MMAGTVSRYLYRLTVNNQYLGITVWTVYCPLLIDRKVKVISSVCVHVLWEWLVKIITAICLARVVLLLNFNLISWIIIRIFFVLGEF